MGRKKQLNVTGNHITDYNLEVKDCIQNNIQSQRLYLDIRVDGQELYTYEICQDTRYTIEYLRNKIPEELDFAIENFNRVTITEYPERFYLFFHVHHEDFSQMQVTGRRW